MLFCSCELRVLCVWTKLTLLCVQLTFTHNTQTFICALREIVMDGVSPASSTANLAEDETIHRGEFHLETLLNRFLRYGTSVISL